MYIDADTCMISQSQSANETKTIQGKATKLEIQKSPDNDHIWCQQKEIVSKKAAE